MAQIDRQFWLNNVTDSLISGQRTLGLLDSILHRVTGNFSGLLLRKQFRAWVRSRTAADPITTFAHLSIAL